MVLAALSERPDFASQLQRRSRVPLLDYLTDAVDMVPDLQAAAIYDTNGQRILAYPDQKLPKGSAANEPWFQSVTRTQQPFVGNVIRLRRPGTPSQEVLIIALPIREESGGLPSGYLLAYYRLRDIEEWLEQVRIMGGSVLILDRKHRVIAAGGAVTKATRWQVPPQDNSPALLLALSGKTGAVVTDDPLGTSDRAVVGYALASRPGWALLVTQPVQSAFASSEYLLRRLSLILLPLLLLLVWTAWLLLRFYHRQQALTRQLAARNRALHLQDREKSDLLANVSHGLKTPITSMQLSISGVLDGEADSDRSHTEECLTLVREELGELEGRVRNLLDMSRLDAGAVPILREPCDLTDITASTLERLSPILQGRPVHAHFPPLPLMVECDQTQMETVLVNLVENAVKYSPPGSALHLFGDFESGFAVLAIRDEGPGVSDSETERIFEKFYRGRGLSGAGGTGLGLTICRTVVEAHGGTIRAGSPSVGGAEFRLRLPRIEESAFAHTGGPAVNPGTPPEFPSETGPPPRV